MAESRGMQIFRSADTSLFIRAVLFDGADVKITAGVTSLRIWHVVPTTGALETYDFNDNLFKALAITTATVAMTHRQAENSTYDTGVWTYRHTTLTDFDVGDKYVFEISHASLPRPVTTEYQYGDTEGDLVSLVVGAVWDEPIAGHVGAGTTGGDLDALGTALDARTNNANLNSLLGVPDEVGATAGVVRVAGTADAGSTNTTIVDAARTEADTDYWHENVVVMTTGPNAGQARRITAFTPASDTITVSPAFTQPVAAGNGYVILQSSMAGDVSIAPADILAIADAVWDEDIVGAHGAASAAGLLLRSLGAAISTRANNATLNALLAVPDVAGNTIAHTIWDAVALSHNVVGSMGEIMNAIGPAIIALPGLVADAVWDEDIVAAHGGASAAGLLLKVLGAGISTRVNNATLNSLLGVTDGAGNTLIVQTVNEVWDEDIVGAHGTASTAGLLLRALGAGIAARANNATLNGLLGVPDVASNDIAFTILDEVIDGATHHTATTVGRRLYDIDILTQVGGAGDLVYTHDQVKKIDKGACDSPPTADSLADKIDDMAAIIAVLDRQIVASLNIESNTLRIEIAVEQYGIILTAPWTQCTAQFISEVGAIVRTVSPAEFGAIGARGFFTYTWSPHTLNTGATYQVLVTLTDGVSTLQSTKCFKVITV
jgi:hypothetical protein